MKNKPEYINNKLNSILFKQYHEQYQRVFNQAECDIEPEFLGFITTYYYLSYLIPKHFTIIDFGCAYAPQAYYFINHKKYIGVDCSVITRFIFPNTEHRINTIDMELKNWKNKNTEQIFAICSYVPTDTFMLRKIFSNLFVYYPSTNSSNKIP